MDSKLKEKPQIRQAGSAEAFVDSTTTGKECGQYLPFLKFMQSFSSHKHFSPRKIVLGVEVFSYFAARVGRAKSDMNAQQGERCARLW